MTSRTLQVTMLVFLLIGLLGGTGVTRENEFRAGWVVAWRSMTSPETIEAVIENAREGNLNALFVQVRASGDAYYNSDFVPRSQHLRPQPDSFDPLQYAIEKAKPLGIEIHAWVNMGLLWRTKQKPLDERHPFNTHPEWLLLDANGKVNPVSSTWEERVAIEGPYWLAFGVPEVKRYLHDVVMEIVTKYDVDGIHYDYIRYPARQGIDNVGVGYNPESVSRFREETGLNPRDHSFAFDQWRARQITELLQDIKRSIKRVDPEVEVSAAVLAPWDVGLGRCFQDARKWLELGAVDFVVPMSYNQDKERVYRDGWNYLEVTDGSRIVLGLKHFTFPNELAEQIAIARELGLRGVAIFPWEKKDDLYAMILRKQVFPTPVAIPDLNEQPRVPTIYSERNPLMVRVGCIDSENPGFVHRVFTRNGQTWLVIHQEGLSDLTIRLNGQVVPVQVTGEIIEVDVSSYVQPETNPGPANHTITFEASGEGDDFRAVFYWRDFYCK